jgi:hypothetical protein
MWGMAPLSRPLHFCADADEKSQGLSLTSAVYSSQGLVFSDWRRVTEDESPCRKSNPKLGADPLVLLALIGCAGASRPG